MDYEYEIEFAHPMYGDVVVTGKLSVSYEIQKGCDGDLTTPPEDDEVEITGWEHCGKYLLTSEDREFEFSTPNKYIDEKIQELVDWDRVREEIWEQQYD